MSKSKAQHVVLHTMFCNTILVILKLTVGILAWSASLIAEAVHSIGDILASLAVYVSFRLSGKPADNRHHYGHGKIESVVSCLVGLLLIYIGYELATEALSSLSSGQANIPGVAALYVAAICIMLKEAMYRYTIRAACQSGSRLLFADAWHHRTDMMILTGVFAGTAGARLGYPVVDGLVALGISVLVIRLGFGVCRQGLGDLIDTAPDELRIREISETVKNVGGVLELHCIRARQFGSDVHLELRIGVDRNLRVQEGHDVAKEVKRYVMEHFPDVSHITVHVNPVDTA